MPYLPQFGDLEILYVVFDILYLDTGSVINRTLTERQELLRQALAPQQMEPFTVGTLLSCAFSGSAAYSSVVTERLANPVFVLAWQCCVMHASPAPLAEELLRLLTLICFVLQGRRARRGS